nr:glycosyltransferase family 2 protein [uncultured Tolumonas sp.]
MAVLYRTNEDILFLKLDSQLSEQATSIHMKKDAFYLKLQAIVCISNQIALKDDTFIIERAALFIKNDAEILVTQKNGLTIQEKLYFEPSFFLKHIDLSKSESFPPYNYSTYLRSKKIAIFTHASNESIFLDKFIQYYSQFSETQDIYVIIHGHEPNTAEKIKKNNCQSICIPKGNVDHLNIKRYVEYFQRFLLTQYEWVLHVDCDELLVHKNGVDYIKNILLDEHKGKTLQAEFGLNIIHDPDNESELDPSCLFTLQRSKGKYEEAYAKPVLSSIPTTWGLGFHKCLNDLETVIVPDLYLVHLAHISLAEKLRRNKVWMNYNLSKSDSEFVTNQHRQTDNERTKEDLQLMLQTDTIDLPEWIKGQF